MPRYSLPLKKWFGVWSGCSKHLEVGQRWLRFVNVRTEGEVLEKATFWLFVILSIVTTHSLCCRKRLLGSVLPDCSLLPSLLAASWFRTAYKMFYKQIWSWSPVLLTQMLLNNPWFLFQILKNIIYIFKPTTFSSFLFLCLSFSGYS